MIVVDASAAIEVLLGEQETAGVQGRVFLSEDNLHAPHLIDVELAHALRRHAALGWLTPNRARQALEDWALLNISRHSHEAHLPRIWELRHNLTAYDAVYVALAEFLGAPLITRDSKLARANGHKAQIEVI